MDPHKTNKDKMVSDVLIVDDHTVLRQGLSKLINLEKDLNVCGDADGVATAMDAIKDHFPDVVLVDLTLEDGNGIRLVEHIRHYHKNLPVLVLSMHDESTYAERCLNAGAMGYIMKKDPSEQLLSAIRKVLKGEIYVSDSLNTILLNKFIDGKIDKSISAVNILSNRELEIYQFLGQGLDKREIAIKLNLSVKTIETYKENIKGKLHLKNAHELSINAIKFVHNM